MIEELLQGSLEIYQDFLVICGDKWYDFINATDSYLSTTKEWFCGWKYYMKL